MSKLFVVYLITYSGSKMPKYYIGSTSLEKIEEGYMGSVRSKKYKEIFYKELRENKQLFSVEILSIHEDREDALSEEYKLQRKYNVIKNEEFINQSYASKNGFFGMDVRGELNPNYDNRWSKEQRNEQSKKLRSEKVQQTKKQTNIKRYGVERPAQNTEVKRKTKLTCQEKWGFDTPFQVEEFKLKAKETKLKKYVDEKYNNHEKAKETKLKKYGDEYYSDLKKFKETKLKKYGDEKYNNHEKYKNTCLEKYGVENSFQSDLIKEKIKKTNLEKYGVENPAQNEEIKKRQIKTRKFNDKKYNRTYKGEKNSNAKNIKIYNEKDELIFHCLGNFKEVCEENSLPIGPLRKSYGNDGEPIFTKKHSKKLVKRYGNEKFIGWYAIKEEKKKC